jgi:hypothetical protein
MPEERRKPEKRTASLVVRLTPKEMEMVQEIAGKRGKTISEWIREKLYEAPQTEAAEIFYRARMLELMDLWRENRLTDKVNDKGKIQPDEILPSRGAREKIAVDYLKKEINKAYLADKKTKGKKKKEPGKKKAKETKTARKKESRKKS